MDAPTARAIGLLAMERTVRGLEGINVVVVATSPDTKAEVIAAAVETRPDMALVQPGVIEVARVQAVIDDLPLFAPCAVVVVGPASEVAGRSERWLAARSDLVVLHVEVIGDVVRIALRDPRLDSLLSALRDLVQRIGEAPEARTARVELRSDAGMAIGELLDGRAPRRPLLRAAVHWIRHVLRDAVERMGDDGTDLAGLAVTRAAVLGSFDVADAWGRNCVPADVIEADLRLDAQLDAADARTEPLAAVAQLDVTPLELRMLLLSLAPELDPRFQRAIGLLLDDMGRRSGTTPLYASLLGETTRMRGELLHAGGLARWLLFDASGGGRQPASDEALRLDPFVVQWLLGDRTALARDPVVRRALRRVRWPGAELLVRPEESSRAADLVAGLTDSADGARWLLLGGDDPAGWFALIELTARLVRLPLVRLDARRLVGADVLEIEECARRVGRLVRLTNALLAIDASALDGAEPAEDGMRVLLAALGGTSVHAALVCRDEAPIVRLLGSMHFDRQAAPPLSTAARRAAVRVAATGAGVSLDESEADAIATRFQLDVARLEQAMHLARSRPADEDTNAARRARFTAACREIVAEGLSQLAERIDPPFDLDDVVLPAERKEQLVEIVDNVRLASQVLDAWRFGERLPYGRGVSALFAGASGTGKTMAALGIARRLGIQVLRLDLSRVVSKYIGDTEKNIDRVFDDARRSGAAILIDEADALFGKRSEVKDAHDRYANIEVAYLLQRMEAYEGLAVLTTNLRQNLDPALLRRLRFIVEFPRPDAVGREAILRRCLPPDAHVLDDAAFRLLARRIDLTGGHLLQITLRAAFLAAAANTTIALVHMVHAANAELAKLGMAPIHIDGVASRRAA